MPAAPTVSRPDELRAANEPAGVTLPSLRVVVVVPQAGQDALKLFVLGFAQIAIASLRAEQVSHDPVDLDKAS
jgi:hypothetical protein